MITLCAEGLGEPFVGDLLRCQRGGPGKASEGIPVGLCKMVATPVGIIADIGHTCHRFQAGGLHKREEFLPHRCEIDQMVGGAEILLGDLELHHHRSLLHRSKQRAIGLTWLEVDGTVLNLDDDVVGKLTVERHKLQTGLICTVWTLRCIDKGAPHHNTLVGLEHPSQHIGTIGV